jgi:CrcB protein
MIWLAIAIGGAMGALARYGTTQAVVSVSGTTLASPIATLMVNIIGSAIMGACYGFLAGGGGFSEPMRLFLMVGFLGALTTFSTFSLDVIMLAERGQVILAVLYATGSVVVSVSIFLMLYSLFRGFGSVG